MRPIPNASPPKRPAVIPSQTPKPVQFGKPQPLNAASRKPVPHQRPMSASISKKRKIKSLSLSSSIAIPALGTNARSNITGYLIELHDARQLADQRSHEALHQIVVSSYGAALQLAKYPDEWVKFCNDPFWSGDHQVPKPERTKYILRYALKRVFGKNCSRASNWFLRLRQEFNAGVCSNDIAAGLKRKAKAASSSITEASAKPKRRVPIVVGKSSKFRRCYDLGVFEAEKGSIPFKVEEGVCVSAMVIFSYCESREKPTPLGVINARQVISAAKTNMLAQIKASKRRR